MYKVITRLQIEKSSIICCLSNLSMNLGLKIMCVVPNYGNRLKNLFGSSSIINRDQNIVYETLISNSCTLFDIMDEGIIRQVFKHLNHVDIQLYDDVLSHGDFSLMNIL